MIQPTQFNRRAFLGTAATLFSSALLTNRGQENSFSPRKTVQPELDVAERVAKDLQLTFTPLVVPENSSALIVHFGIAHSVANFSGLQHLTKPEVACSLPYIFASESLQESIGLRFRKDLGGRMVGAVCEGATRGPIKQSVFEPEAEFRTDCSEDAKEYLNDFLRGTDLEKAQLLAFCEGAGAHYVRLSSGAEKFRPEELGAFKNLAWLYKKVAEELEKKDVKALSKIEEHIQRTLFSGRESLRTKMLPLYGSELLPAEHIKEARLILALYNGGEILVGPAPAIAIQSARNGRYIEQSAELLGTTSKTSKVLLVYLGCGAIHDLSYAVREFNTKHQENQLSLCRLDLPPLVSHSKT